MHIASAFSGQHFATRQCCDVVIKRLVMIYLLKEHDYAIARRLIQEIFRAGAEVVWVGQDKGATDLLAKHHFDLAILSIYERDLEPDGLLSQLCANGCNVPVVLLVEKDQCIGRDLIDGLDIADRLRKPFAPWALRKHLRPLLLHPPGRRFRENSTASNEGFTEGIRHHCCDKDMKDI